jgi:hypothetical protein
VRKLSMAFGISVNLSLNLRLAVASSENLVFMSAFISSHIV